MLDKTTLRAQIKQQRSAISLHDWERWSTDIQKRLFAYPAFLKAHTIHCYVSMNDRKEVDTHGIVESCLKRNKSLFVPIMKTEVNELQHVEVSTKEELKPNAWGVPEPEYGERLDVIDPDLVIVPLLASDEKGNRLGYGKGYYDRFLSQISSIKVGLVFDQFILDEIPTEPHDIPLDVLITETRIINV